MALDYALQWTIVSIHALYLFPFLFPLLYESWRQTLEVAIPYHRSRIRFPILNLAIRGREKLQTLVRDHFTYTYSQSRKINSGPNVTFLSVWFSFLVLLDCSKSMTLLTMGELIRLVPRNVAWSCSLHSLPPQCNHRALPASFLLLPLCCCSFTGFLTRWLTAIRWHWHIVGDWMAQCQTKGGGTQRLIRQQSGVRGLYTRYQYAGSSNQTYCLLCTAES